MKIEMVPTETFRALMNPEVADLLQGKLKIVLNRNLPVIPLGTRIYIVEVAGPGAARTGRAALYRVAVYRERGTILERTWAWSQGKVDDDLGFLGLQVGPERFSTLTLDDVAVEG